MENGELRKHWAVVGSDERMREREGDERKGRRGRKESSSRGQFGGVEE